MVWHPFGPPLILDLAPQWCGASVVPSSSSRTKPPPPPLAIRRIPRTRQPLFFVAKFVSPCVAQAVPWHGSHGHGQGLTFWTLVMAMVFMACWEYFRSIFALQAIQTNQVGLVICLIFLIQFLGLVPCQHSIEPSRSSDQRFV